MTPEHHFPPPPPASVTRDAVVLYLIELETRGWVIYEAPGGFTIQTTETDQLDLSLNETNGTCSFHGSSSARGITSSGPSVQNMIQFEDYMRQRTGGPTPAKRVLTRRGEPAHNVIRIAQLIINARAKVEAVYDVYLDDEGLRTFSTLVRLSRAAIPRLRLLTSRHGAKALNPSFAANLLRELGCPQAEIRQTSIKGHEGRFLLLNGGRTLRLGMSLNRMDTNDFADIGDGHEDRPLFEREWAVAQPV